MEIVRYAAMTAAEFEKNSPISTPIAYMACHFSPYATGLCNLPRALPPGSLLILNDRTPICGHDAALVARQLAQTAEALQCRAILLDLQRPGADSIVAAVTALACPVAVSAEYAAGRSCAVFLPPPPLTVPLPRHIAPWSGREIWLEASMERSCIRITREGSRQLPAGDFPCPHVDAPLHCRYGIDVQDRHVDFHLQRDGEQLRAMLEEATALGISTFVGLYQQLFPSGGQ